MCNSSRALLCTMLVAAAAALPRACCAEESVPDIEPLLRGLADADFDAREAATQKLKKSSEAIVPAVLKAKEACKDPDVLERLDAILWECSPAYCLLQLYRAYELPLPPENAKLVRFEYGHTRDADKRVPNYYLAFLLEPAKDDEDASLVLLGPQVRRMSLKNERIIDSPKTFDPADVRTIWMDNNQNINCGLATAIQCKARGWDGLAAKLLTASEHPGEGAFAFSLTGKQPRIALAEMAWEHHAGDLTTPGSDRAALARRLKKLLASEPVLRTDLNRLLLESLEAVLKPSAAKPGSIEALIDGLTEVSSKTRNGEPAEPHDDPHYLKLALLGFEAVPDLIEHVNDWRLTRVVEDFKQNDNYPLHYRVGHLASDLLKGMAGEESSHDEPRWTQKAAAQAWWEKAQKAGEEAYFVQRSLPDDPKKKWPNILIVRILAAKYPKRLPEIYRKLLHDRPNLESGTVAGMIADSLLPKDEKIKLLAEAGTHPVLQHRQEAFWKLKNLDPPRFVDMLIATLEGLPKTPQGHYWGCPESSFAQLVIQTEDPRAWQALLDAARRADVGLRMEMLNPMTYFKVQTKQRIAFLAEFLQDDSIRDRASNKAMYEGPCAGFTLNSRLAVRDFAAARLATILNLPAEPAADWTEKQWSELREAVRNALPK